MSKSDAPKEAASAVVSPKIVAARVEEGRLVDSCKVEIRDEEEVLVVVLVGWSKMKG